MNDLRTVTLTTLEVAEMMEVPHSDLLKKLEGRKDRKGYIQILNEGQMSVVDYFVKSSYLDAKGEERPCYEVTRLGCDFLANKSTGEKGVLFTARYVKRFYEMENPEAGKPLIDASTLKGIANTGNLIERVMRNEWAKPYKTALVLDTMFKQSGLYLPEDFVVIPEYEQMDLAQFSQEDRLGEGKER